MKVGVVSCARCGGNHVEVELLALQQPVLYLALPIATHWAPCPANGQPILVRVIDNQPAQQEL